MVLALEFVLLLGTLEGSVFCGCFVVEVTVYPVPIPCVIAAVCLGAELGEPDLDLDADSGGKGACLATGIGANVLNGFGF